MKKKKLCLINKYHFIDVVTFFKFKLKLNSLNILNIMLILTDYFMFTKYNLVTKLYFYYFFKFIKKSSMDTTAHYK